MLNCVFNFVSISPLIIITRKYIKEKERECIHLVSFSRSLSQKGLHTNSGCPALPSWNANALRCCCRLLSRIFLRTLSSTSKFRIGLESVLSFLSKSFVRCMILPISCESVSSFDRQFIRRKSMTSFVQLLYPSTNSCTSPRLFVSTWISSSILSAHFITWSWLCLCCAATNCGNRWRGNEETIFLLLSEEKDFGGKFRRHRVRVT